MIIGNKNLIWKFTCRRYKKLRMFRYNIKKALPRRSRFVFGGDSSKTMTTAESIFLYTKMLPRVDKNTKGK